MSDTSNSIAYRRLNAISSQVTSSSSNPTFNPFELKYVKCEVKDRVAIITLNNPPSLNALSDALIRDLTDSIEYYNDPQRNIGCIIITGAGKAFAAGADIKEMANRSFSSMYTYDKIAPWTKITNSKIPLIAAVNGFALGGGCEIAMMCDIIIASENAKFGQPEINIGTIPGAGGTQRLTRIVGKSKAMELCLTGSMISAAEAEKIGLISHVYPSEQLLPQALKLANQIASQSLPLVKLCKEAVNSAYETTLTMGMQVERKIFHSTFALEDQKIGMNAFVKKTKPVWKHE